METIQIEVGKLKPNPFKKNINKGKLNQKTISKLIESIEHGTLPEIFSVRKSGKDLELCFGHHRQWAIIKKKGRDYKILCNIVDRTDKQMIVDMARENLAQRSDDFKEERATILFVKKYLKKNNLGVMGHDGKWGGNRSREIGSRQIAQFLSKDEKVVSHNKVARILKIEKDIAPEIIKIIERSSNQWDKEEGKISVSIAEEVSQIKDHKDQKLILKEVQEKEIGHKRLRRIVSVFKNLSEEAKKGVRKGEIELQDLLERFKGESLLKPVKYERTINEKVDDVIRDLTSFKNNVDEVLKDINKDDLFKSKLNVAMTNAGLHIKPLNKFVTFLKDKGAKPHPLIMAIIKANGKI